MDHQLEALTRKLYTEGIQKAESEAGDILAKAQKDADHLLGVARDTADDIRDQANRDAEQLLQRARAELRLATEQTLGSVRTALEGLIRKEVLEQPVSAALHQTDALIEVIKIAIQKMDIPKDGEPRILLSPEDESKVGKPLREGLQHLFQKEPMIQPLPGIRAGFRIQNGEGGYQLSFTDEDFIAFLMPYLSKEVQQILRPDHEQS